MPKKKKKTAVPRSSIPQEKRREYKILHVDDRHGVGWPRTPGSGRNKNWTGWLTYREYDIFEMCIRYEENNIYALGAALDVRNNTSNKMFYNLLDAGMVIGEPDLFEVTPMAKILFDMTDQYILELDLGGDDE